MRPNLCNMHYAAVVLAALAFPGGAVAAGDGALRAAEDKITAWAEASLPGDRGPGLSRDFRMGSYQPLPTGDLFTGLDPIEAGWITDFASTYLDVAFQPCADDDILFDLFLDDADELPYIEHCRQVIADFQALYGATHPGVRARMWTYTDVLDATSSTDHRFTEAAHYEAVILRSLIDAGGYPVAAGGLADLATALLSVNFNYSSLQSLDSDLQSGFGQPQLREPEPADVRDATYLALIQEGLQLLESLKFVPNWQYQTRADYDGFLSRLKVTLVKLFGATGNVAEAQGAAAPLLETWRDRLGPEAEALDRTALHDVISQVGDVMEALRAADMRDDAIEIGRRAVVLARQGNLPKTEWSLLSTLRSDLRASDAVVGVDGATVSERLELYPIDVVLDMEPDVPYGRGIGVIENDRVPTTLDCKGDLEAALDTRPKDRESLDGLLAIISIVTDEIYFGKYMDAAGNLEFFEQLRKELNPEIKSCALMGPELLARAYAGSARLDEAEELYSDVRESYRNTTGADTYEYYRATMGLAGVLLSKGRMDAGHALTIEGLSLFGALELRNVHGFVELDEVPATAAAAMTRFGRRDRAVSFARQAFEYARDQSGYFQGAALPSLGGYAAALSNAGQYDKALDARRVIASFGGVDEFLSMAQILAEVGRADIAGRYAKYLFDLTMASLNDPDSDLPEQDRLIRAQIATGLYARVLVEEEQYFDAFDLGSASVTGLADLLGDKDIEVRSLYLAILRALVGLEQAGGSVGIARLLLENEAEAVKDLTLAEARRALLPGLQTFAARAMRDYAKLGGGDAPEDQPEALRDEAFVVLQSGRVNPASEAVARNVARASLADADLAPLFRDWSELLQARDALRIELMASVDRGALIDSEWLERSTELDDQIAAAEASLSSAAPDLFERAKPRPIGLAEIASPTSGLLTETEALVYLLPGIKEARGLVFVASHKGIAWADLEMSAEDLTTEVSLLHSEAREGMRAFVPDSIETDSARFDAARAHALYVTLFGNEDIASLLAEAREWIIVANGPLLSLPFNALPMEPVSDGEMRSARWLGTEKALSILPDVASLTRRSDSSPAPVEGTRGFIAFADPDFGGGSYEQAPLLHTAEFTSDGRTVRGALNALAPLPGTRREAEAMADQYGPENAALFLSDQATETELFRLSATGALEKAEVLLIATHGLIAGAADGVTEPALALTPPPGDGHMIELASFRSDSPLPGQPVDDGLLTASEAAMLRIDADWVILSACDTASGASPNAEGLSGLASGFLTAGAKSLLVSHWPVDDVAAERLTTFAVAALRDDPLIGRAEAMRLSMLELIETAGEDSEFVHPAFWAPFQVIGLD